MFKANGWPPGRVSAMAARHNDESVKHNGSSQTGVHQHANFAGESNPAPTNNEQKTTHKRRIHLGDASPDLHS